MFINCTPHEVYDVKSRIRLAYDKANEIRTDTTSEIAEIIDGIEIFTSNVALRDPLPPEVPGVIYVVSALCLNAIPAGRKDFVCPGNPVRKGKDKEVYGCRGFRRNK